MVAVEDAIRIVLEHTPVLGPEDVPLEESEGRVLAESVVAHDEMPPFAASSVDGYAVRVADRAAPRRVLSEITAGVAEARTVEPGTAVRIMTGAPLPDGADAVVMVEQVTERDGMMIPEASPAPGENVHRQGQDVHRGQEVLAPGAVLGAAEIGVLATVGRVRVRVHRRPVVAVLATGDELVEPGESLRPGAIRDSNRYALLAAVREAGAIPVSLGMARDVEAEQEARIRAGLEQADVVLTSGGVSVGSRDLIKPILRRIGTIHFGRVSFKPGKPTTFATIEGATIAGATIGSGAGGERIVFGLPGFPVSSLVSFEVFVRPALRRMQGHRQVRRPFVRVTLEHAVSRSPDRPEYQRAVVRFAEGKLLAHSTGVQRSSRLLSLVGANALLRIDPGEGSVAAGEVVDALLIGEIAG
jgi:molybdopterin molybdotransferase